ncbi:type II toxin-antitoxin system VapC family toxin [Lacipirellula limnantheis]|uniref:PIN domain-containing protein n=1 Tax=Lacipirellula limnantheis TaxID=2528024 RepID=A0A517U6B0_9BACT|nr:type II toxin-antitoxin system VapC family toxin [Lacipirellula limnantheis]QDT76154.1 hypothetical protein I41_53990 [Lacipirellula limnantheis]
MLAVVVDASATLAWLFGEGDPADWLEANLSSMTLSAPALWRLEVVNAIVIKERRKQITQSQDEELLTILDALPIAIVQSQNEPSLLSLANLARTHQLTAYDAAYLDLARSERASLLTLDANLIDAAQRINVPLIAMQ